jgi:hypothetical protein
VPLWVYQEVGGLQDEGTWEEGLVGGEVQNEGHVGEVVGEVVGAYVERA